MATAVICLSETFLETKPTYGVRLCAYLCHNALCMITTVPGGPFSPSCPAEATAGSSGVWLFRCDPGTTASPPELSSSSSR